MARTKKFFDFNIFAKKKLQKARSFKFYSFTSLKIFHFQAVLLLKIQYYTEGM